MDENAEPISSGESEREEGELSNEDDEIIILSEVGNVDHAPNSLRNLASYRYPKREDKPVNRGYYKRVRSPSPVRYRKQSRRRRISRRRPQSLSRSRSRSRDDVRKKSSPSSAHLSKEGRKSRSSSIEVLEVNKNTVIVEETVILEAANVNLKTEEKLSESEDEELALRLAALSSVKLLENGSKETGEAKTDEKSAESDGEESELRLAALRSVKSKENLRDEPSPQPTMQTDQIVSSTKQEEEEEDEELLRAKLLIDVARRQVSSVNQVEELPQTRSAKEEQRNGKAIFDIPIPKTAPLVINLQHDSDSSDEDFFQASVEQLLKNARHSSEQSVSAKLPNALNHLPKHQQEEYYRLKQEIARRETNLQKKENETKPATPENVTLIEKATLNPTVKKPKPNPLRISLNQKKRDMGRITASLGEQLRVVQSSRAEWEKSKEEVLRLKLLLQQAEQAELKSKSTYEAAQKNLISLRNNLKTTENQIILLEKRLKTVKPKKPVSPQKKAVPVATPLKTKPLIVAKALQRNVASRSVPSRTVRTIPTVKPPQRKMDKNSDGNDWLFGVLGEEWAFEGVDHRKSVESYRSPLTALYAPPERRLDPAAVICRYDLDFSCRDPACKFQHLPKAPKESSASSRLGICSKAPEEGGKPVLCSCPILYHYCSSLYKDCIPSEVKIIMEVIFFVAFYFFAFVSSGPAKVFVTFPGGKSVVRRH